MGKYYHIAFISVALFISAAPVCAEVIEVEGVATMNAGIEYAREMAMQDAKNQASMQAGTDIKMSNEANSNGIPLESSRVRPTVKIDKVIVLREWQDGDTYHVRIEATTEQSVDPPLINQKYRKKITSTPFNVQNPYQTDDINNISGGFSRELLRRLESGNSFLTKISPHVISVATNGPSQDNEAVKTIAALYDSQFVIAGEILDAGSSDEGGIYGFFQHKRRRFEVDVFVYDGLTGGLIARHRIEKFAVGEVSVDRNMPFASASFFSTNFGHAVSDALDSATELISRDLESIPFTAKVIRVANGKIYINAGGTSFIAPGDKLVAYQINEMSVSGLGFNGSYGAAESPVGTVSIIQVQPMFSICTLQQSERNVKIKVGDLLRFDFVDQTQN